MEQTLAQSSEGTNSTDPLITDVQPQELSENKLLLYKPTNLLYFTMAALGN